MNKSSAVKTDLSLLRVIAASAIIFLHTCSSVIDQRFRDVYLDPKAYSFFVTGKIMMKWALPVFIMITGALMLDPERKITVRDCLRKYALRMFLVILLFGIPMAWMARYFHTHAITAELLLGGIGDVLTGNSWDHLWYLYELTAVYLLMPFIRKASDAMDDKEHMYILAALFALDFVLPFLYRFLNIQDWLQIPMGYWIFYLLAGHMLYQKRTEIRKVIPACAGIVSLVLMIVFCRTDIFRADAMLVYDNPLTAVLSMSVFALVCGRQYSAQKLLWKLDRLCFAVYLIHPFFIHLLYAYLQKAPSASGYAAETLLYYAGFTLVSFACAWLMKLVYPLNKLI
ncbi:MAG: acyltransferase [Solobacterium sp.]|nr:acyltransferase [Solobacterium sp.]